MPLQKQAVSINFGRGVDTKTDPYQVQVGSFLSLVNSIFTVAGRLTKRLGFTKSTATGLGDDATTITTLNDNLIATGANLYALSADTNQWLNQGLVQPVQLNTLPLLRSSTSQTAPDAYVASNGLICLVYIDSGVAYYQVSDSKTGQQIVKRTALPNAAFNPRVFVLGAYFIVMFLADIAGAYSLRYIAIPTANPSAPSTTQIIAPGLTATTGYDADLLDNSTINALYIAWGSSSTSVSIVYLTNTLIMTAPTIITTTAIVNLMAVSVDAVNNLIYMNYAASSATTAYASSVDFQLMVQFTGVTLPLTGPVVNLTSVAQSISGLSRTTTFYEIDNNYSYTDNIGDAIRTDYIQAYVVFPGPAVSDLGIILRSVGLASKAFIGGNGVPYVLTVYGDTTQINPADNSNESTYFLMDQTGSIYLKLAYSNGGGYAHTQVLPNVSTLTAGSPLVNTYYIPYLLTDFLATVNKGTALPTGTPTNAIYTQTGINLASFTMNTTGQLSSEIASALHLTGGILWEYDGVKPVEHGFNLWPENVVITTAATGGGLAPQEYFYQFTYEWTDNAGNLHRSAPSIPVSVTATGTATTFTSVFAAGVSSITVSSAAGLVVGQIFTDTTTPANILVGTYITSISGTTIGLSQPTTGASASTPGDTLTTSSTAINTINVPTYRITYKQPFDHPSSPLVTNPVRIVGYRWSVAQEVYYQFTSITAPVLNDTTIDSVVITDAAPDITILGQTLLYTTGGVVEDIGAPPSIASCLFDNRLWLIDAEDQNLLWFSKSVIESVPVEMSDLLTFYVAPTTGAQYSTGPMTALGAMDDKLIIFKKDAIYYINGTGPDNTGANSSYPNVPIFVTSAVGCSNPQSVVVMTNGVMFQSDKGIWLLGRDLSTNYIGAQVEAFNTNIVKSATVIPGTNQVRFVLDNNMTLVYDFFFQQWSTHTNVLAISATLYQSAHTYLNSNIDTFQETPNFYLDGSTPVLMSLTTSWISTAGLQGFERFYFAFLLGTYYTPFKLNVALAYDYNSSYLQQTLVTPDNQAQPWGGEASWGSGGPWGGAQDGNVFQARLFPENQKCETFQVVINEIYDPSYNIAPGEGLSLSGLSLIIGTKRGFRTQRANRSFG